MKIANQDLSKVLGRANECMRRLIEAGLTYEDLQVPITDPKMRERLVRYWRNPINALAHNTLVIDRSKKFDSKTYLSFLSDHLNDKQKKIYYVKEEDNKSLALTEIDLNGVIFETGLLPEDKMQGVEVCIDRLKASDRILLDAKIFETLWKNKNLIPESWKNELLAGVSSIVFAGTLFANDEYHVERCKLEALKLSYSNGEYHRHTINLVNTLELGSVVFATLPDFSS